MEAFKIEYEWRWFRDNADDIELWFDAETFNWHTGSWLLAIYCTKDFNIWFDPDKYYYYDHSHWLIWKCWDDRNVWLSDRRYRNIFFHRGVRFRSDHGFLPIVKVKV